MLTLFAKHFHIQVAVGFDPILVDLDRQRPNEPQAAPTEFGSRILPLRICPSCQYHVAASPRQLQRRMPANLAVRPSPVTTATFPVCGGISAIVHSGIFVLPSTPIETSERKSDLKRFVRKDAELVHTKMHRIERLSISSYRKRRQPRSRNNLAILRQRAGVQTVFMLS